LGILFGRGDRLQRESRRINSKIRQLERLQEKMELKGCLSDSDLVEKEQTLEDIRRDILRLESEREKLWATQLIKNRTEEDDSPSDETNP